MNNTCQITLKGGEVTTVNADMFEKLNAHVWTRGSRGGYVKRYLPRNGGKVVVEWMHRVVNATPDDLKTDHVNGDKLDNRRENLRSATTSQNGANAPKRAKNASSQYKGVTWHKKSKRWKSVLEVQGREYSCACLTERDAAIAYNRLAQMHFGEFAFLNDVGDDKTN